MEKIYYDLSSPASFSGVKTLQEYTKEPLDTVREWLSGVPAYTLHKPIRKKFPRIKTVAFTSGEQLQIDLADLSSIAKYNDGFKYLLTCIDVFSRYAWVIPVKSKSGKDIQKALEVIFQDVLPVKIQADQGTEFSNKIVQNFLKEKGITFFFTRSEKKAAVVERLNRTIKNKMWKYFSYTKTYRYVDVLPKLVKSYNNTKHSSTGYPPSFVTKENEHLIWLKQRKVHATFQFPKYHVGDNVRIVKLKQKFDKGYEQGWSTEIFQVAEVFKTVPVTYRLKDFNSEEIEGRFYEPELQKVKLPDLFEIEKILDRKKGKVLVKWKGYPSSMNSWVKEEDLQLL